MINCSDSAGKEGVLIEMIINRLQRDMGKQFSQIRSLRGKKMRSEKSELKYSLSLLSLCTSHITTKTFPCCLGLAILG